MAILQVGNTGYPALKINPYQSIVANESGLVCGYDAKNISGTTVVDSSPNQLNGTITGGTTLNAQTIVGKTVTFNGTTQSIAIPDNDKLSFADANGVFTVIIIAKRNSSNNGGIFGKYGAAQLEYCNQIISNVMYFFTFDNTGGGYRGRTTAANALAADSAYHLVVFKKTAGALTTNHEIWTDNAQVDSGNFTSGSYTQMRNTTSILNIGFVGTGAVQYFPGDIKYWKLLNRTPSTTELTNWYNTFNEIRTRDKTLSNLKITP